MIPAPNSAADLSEKRPVPQPREGEWVYLVPPLAVPTEDSLDREDSLRYGAVWPFVEQARPAAPHLVPHARVAAVIAGICRRLDGIPLTTIGR
jgi:predicted ATPase